MKCLDIHNKRIYELEELLRTHLNGKEWADVIINGEGARMARDYCELECGHLQLCKFYRRYGE